MPTYKDPDHGILFGVTYIQRVRENIRRPEISESNNVWIMDDITFDSDIDQNFQEAQKMYYETLKMEPKFLKREH